MRSMCALLALCCAGVAMGVEGGQKAQDVQATIGQWKVLGVVTEAAPLVVETKDGVVAVLPNQGLVEVVVASAEGEPTITHQLFQGEAVVIADEATGEVRVVSMSPDSSSEPGDSSATAATSGSRGQGTGDCRPGFSNTPGGVVGTITCQTSPNYVPGPMNSLCIATGCTTTYSDGSYYRWVFTQCFNNCSSFGWLNTYSYNAATGEYCASDMPGLGDRGDCQTPQ